MMECPTSEILSAYYDGELEPVRSDEVRAHLLDCERCRSELRMMEGLSAAIADERESLHMLPIELARVRATTQTGAMAADGRRSVVRVAAFFGTMAASILVISGAWLVDLERSPRQMERSMPVAVAPDWEHLASTLRAEPRPGMAGEGSPYTLRYAQAVEWMLRNHIPVEQKPWGKPL